jgi:hypothetical protein
LRQRIGLNGNATTSQEPVAAGTLA